MARVTGLFSPVTNLLTGLNALIFGGAHVLCGKYLGKRMVKRTRSVFSLDMIIMMILSALLLIVLEVTLSTYRQESVLRIPNPHLQPELQE